MQKKFSLWIKPSTQILEYSQPIIERLSKEYSLPLFPAHITLLGEFIREKDEIVEKTKAYAKTLTPFEIQFSEVSFSTTFFQAVFFRVKSSAKLLEANLHAKEQFEIENSVYMPHMSITYGNKTIQEREDIAHSLKLPNLPSFQFETIVINTGSDDTKDWEQVLEIPIGR